METKEKYCTKNQVVQLSYVFTKIENITSILKSLKILKEERRKKTKYTTNTITLKFPLNQPLSH